MNKITSAALGLVTGAMLTLAGTGSAAVAPQAAAARCQDAEAAPAVSHVKLPRAMTLRQVDAKYGTYAENVLGLTYACDAGWTKPMAKYIARLALSADAEIPAGTVVWYF